MTDKDKVKALRLVRKSRFSLEELWDTICGCNCTHCPFRVDYPNNNWQCGLRDFIFKLEDVEDGI